MGCNASSSASNAGDAPSHCGLSTSSKGTVFPDDAVAFSPDQRRFARKAGGPAFGSGCVGKSESSSYENLFEDENFPAARNSLSFSDPLSPEFGDVLWKRPWEISDSPHLFVDGTSRSDVKQGLLGNCWFLSACAAVATRQDLIEKVINPNQKLFGEEYKGKLVISFWQFGEWVKICIDDRLPTRDGCLIYGSCTDANEFWLSMVEKAFAKSHGSYEALAGGHALEAFVDLTGGIAEKIDVTPSLFNQLKMIFKHGAFITCSRKLPNGHLYREEPCTHYSKGLIGGHAYTVTSVEVVHLLNGETVNLVRIRNPWGNSIEWEGDWNDRCIKWNQVSQSDRLRLRVTALADGEFWMNFDDFKNEFVDVTVATLGPDFDRDGLTETPRQTEIVRGSWMKNINAGGSRNDLEKFSLNPQFLLFLKESCDSKERGGENEKCSIIVGLMQEHRRTESDSTRTMLPISFFIYKADKINKRLGPSYFLHVEEEATSGDFTNAREVIVRTELDPGHYVIIPATFYPDCETDFMIRIFALKPFTLTEITE